MHTHLVPASYHRVTATGSAQRLLNGETADSIVETLIACIQNAELRDRDVRAGLVIMRNAAPASYRPFVENIIVWQDYADSNVSCLSRTIEREVSQLPDGVIIWFTGHSKSGKTTLTKLIYDELKQREYKVIRLDSDTLPKGIIKPEGDSWEENQQRKNENMIFLSKLLFDNGYYVLISSVGRYNRWRELLRIQVPHYLEIYLKCPLEVRLQRDVTGKYETHQEYFQFYEEPQNPDLIINTNQLTVPEAMKMFFQLFRERGYMT